MDEIRQLAFRELIEPFCLKIDFDEVTGIARCYWHTWQRVIILLVATTKAYIVSVRKRQYLRFARPKNAHVRSVHCAFWDFTRLDLGVFLRHYHFSYRHYIGSLVKEVVVNLLKCIDIHPRPRSTGNGTFVSQDRDVY